MIRSLLLALLAGVAAVPALAANRPWTGGFPQLDTSARGAALGGNIAALAVGSESMFWNPAGLLGQDRKDLSFSYSDLFGLGLVTHSVVQFAWPHLGHKYEWVGNDIERVSLPPPATRAFGVAFSSLRAGLDTGNYIESQLALGFAGRIPGGTQLGIVYRFLKAQTGVDTTADGTGQTIDLGMQQRIGNLRIGFAGANVTSWMNWKKGRSNGVDLPEESDPLATRWSGGLAWVPRTFPLSATVQEDWAGGAFVATQYGAGAEWRILTSLTLRGALRHRIDDLGGRNEWSGGAGFHVHGWQFDYGWQDNARGLGQTQRWSAAVLF